MKETLEIPVFYEYGNRVELLSKRYFGKSSDKLNIDEIRAMLKIINDILLKGVMK